ncbi:MAG: MotA/TolQ/ExbB proton channel family protein [Proteobacteria bacterium]|nr:MotA/TolQ/ExbB proton channel family protein [Pseudomonadota bacterium]
MSRLIRFERLRNFLAGTATAGLLFGFVAAPAAAQDAAPEPTPLVIEGPRPTTADDLLREVLKGWEVERREDKERERSFANAREDQRRLLAEAKATEARAEARSQALEKEYQGNEVTIAELAEALELRMGNLGELFGVTRQVAGDTRGNIEASITTAQYGRERVDFLENLGKNKELPSISELERLWMELVREMVAQGKIVEFEAKVYTPGGIETRKVTRAGAFSVVSNSEYLLWDPLQGQLQELSRQPPARYVDTVGDYQSAGAGEIAGLAVDPSSGSLLAVLIETRGLSERIPDGGAVGYSVITLGIIAALLGIYKMIVLLIVAGKVEAQKTNNRADTGNPLGRILAVAADNPDVDREQLELMLDEVVLRESSKLESLVWLVRIVSVVAPLMGLLGTVTGMIKTFQSITLFGAGDPRMMAGGISEALVTTMLGLLTAIPLVLMHAALANSTKKIVDTLDEQSAGLIAQQE